MKWMNLVLVEVEWERGYVDPVSVSRQNLIGENHASLCGTAPPRRNAMAVDDGDVRDLALLHVGAEYCHVRACIVSWLSRNSRIAVL